MYGWVMDRRPKLHMGLFAARSRALPSKEPSRTEGDHDDHRQEQDDIRQIGEQGGPEGIDGGGDEAADKRSEQAADATENDDDERERQHVRVEAGVGRHDRAAEDRTRP